MLRFGVSFGQCEHTLEITHVGTSLINMHKVKVSAEGHSCPMQGATPRWRAYRQGHCLLYNPMHLESHSDTSSAVSQQLATRPLRPMLYLSLNKAYVKGKHTPCYLASRDKSRCDNEDEYFLASTRLIHTVRHLLRFSMAWMVLVWVVHTRLFLCWRC